MLQFTESDAPPFPCQGAIAFVEGTGEKVQIVQNNADGTCLLKRLDPHFTRKAGTLGRASGNFTVPLAKLHAEHRAALTYAGRQSRRTTSKPRVRKERRATAGVA